ncbi:hypothetical protein BHM03_00045928 [Ensete ventricosum]|nr:hypothetical protein BHM03_00045928 [Ensete ventricosum]
MKSCHDIASAIMRRLSSPSGSAIAFPSATCLCPFARAATLPTPAFRDKHLGRCVSGAPTNNKGWKARYFFMVVRRCKSINDYKQSVGFGWGLRRMGQVSYEYGYLVALARFQARYPEVRSGGRRWDDVAES